MQLFCNLSPYSDHLPYGCDLVFFEQFLGPDFWGLVQNSGKPIRIVPCDLEK